MKKTALLFLFFVLSAAFGQQPSERTAKPWTFWWVMGPAMEKSDVCAQLDELAAAGMGGVHIIPIYPQRGEREKALPFLSDAYMDMLDFVCAEAEKRNMGVDMTMGTGWPFGAPWITSEFSAKKLGRDFSVSPTRQKVKRAAVGGAGLVIDPFSKSAIEAYSAPFERAFAKKGGGVRAFFNDSFEIFGANFTPTFFDDFRRLRGYDFKPHADVLFSDSDTEKSRRLWQDYHNTLADLLEEGMFCGFTRAAHKMGVKTRNQAHGSCGNLLDLYATADIPETESFGSSAFPIPLVRVDADYQQKRFGRPDKLLMKFASSAADIEGKPLVSSETCTWIAEHFKEALSQIKPQIDQLWLGGINHVFYHGMAYSPPSQPFPGKIFYASTNFNQNSHFFGYLSELNKYIAFYQSKLQNAAPQNDILLYFPIHQFWKSSGGANLALMFDVHHGEQWLSRCPQFEKLMRSLDARGYAFDFFSEKMLSRFVPENGLVKTRGASYKTVLVPDVDELPLSVFADLLRLARGGAKVCFFKKIPDLPTGFADLENAKKAAKKYAAELAAERNVLVVDALPELAAAGVLSEPIAETGLQFIRKKTPQGIIYFVANLSARDFDGETSVLGEYARVDFDNFQAGVSGRLKSVAGGGKTKFRLALRAGESCLLSAGEGGGKTSRDFVDFKKYSKSRPLRGWRVDFVENSQPRPAPQTMEIPRSWTETDDEHARYFYGDADYSCKFDISDFSKNYALDLGDVRDCATVFLNGREVSKVWCVPFVVQLKREMLAEHNTLVVRVRNCSFNRIIKMDKDGVKWKIFEDANVKDIQYNNFDASQKQPVPSGLAGEVKLLSD